MMDITFNEEDISLPQVALYSSISFLVVSLVGIFLYITCSRKYKLNWFEKNLLETACENDAVNSGHLAGRYVYAMLLSYISLYRESIFYL